MVRFQRFLQRYMERRRLAGLQEQNHPDASIEEINMDRLNRDFRHALDFESMEVD